ncbi:MAG: hypothetical protein AB2730_18915 [Candidatus Thiodiazotropha sp.]
MGQVTEARKPRMGVAIGLSIASEYGQRMLGQIRQKPWQGKTRGSECRRRADRETRQALSAGAAVDVQTSPAP